MSLKKAVLTGLGILAFNLSVGPVQATYIPPTINFTNTFDFDTAIKKGELP